ncbi:hypothetical protein CY34DRAFT_678975 [Suillus luteus UH-Slu-Lm8-n1]|uniref:Uncharacterized protein n=1 Tax=Suillus luteus UH-Slu-Lm8-n1 TaxID=930992 RepID=A0A0D0AHZ6_9AGAM|nr:hypothetical protein CY34DRAFT_678975 [Suillus luteus UH-Slu-Lm8-n1]
MSKVVMHIDKNSVGPLNIEDQLNSLRGQINEIKEHIELLIMQSAIVRDRRSLLQHQQGIKPLGITEELESTCPETRDSVVSGSLTLNSAAGPSASRLHSESIVTIPSDNIVAVQTPTPSQGATSKLGTKPRRYKPGRRDFQGRSAQLEPPGLFQGWVDAMS